MLTASVDVNGVVIGDMEITNLGPAKDNRGREIDNGPYGGRIYRVELFNASGGTLGTTTVYHRRVDGAWRLIGKAIYELERSGLLPRTYPVT